MNLTRFLQSKLTWISAILIFLPISIQLCTYAVIALIAFTVITLVKTKQKLSFYRNPSFWILSALAWLTLLGLLYTEDMRAGRQALEVQATLAVFPFIFSELRISDLEFRKIKIVFVTVILILCLFLEFRVIVKMLTSGYAFTDNFFSWDYTYENLTSSYVAQPVYFGIYIVLSSLFCLTFFKDETRIGARIAAISILLFNSFFLLQLGARSAVFNIILLATPYAIYILYKRKLLVAGVLIIGFLAMSFVALYFFSGFTRMRVEGTYTEITSNDIKEFDPKSRMLIWPCAIEVIQNHWVFGVGTGDDEYYLFDVYKKRGYVALSEAGLNEHNQYLTTVMRHGLLGAFALMIAILFPIYKYWKNKEIEALLFMGLIVIFFVTENVLNRAQGVIFFSLFHSIYFTLTFSLQKHENTSLRD